MTWINNYLRHAYNAKLRKRLLNKDFSVIASNCNGAVMLHDLGLRFNSPFVNLYILPEDFLKICGNLRYYMEQELDFAHDEDKPFPVGIIGDARIYFEHYGSEEEAREKWNERKQRIRYDDLFLLFSDRDGCTYEDLKRFDRLPYPNKAVFCCRPYPEIASCVYIPGFEDRESVGVCLYYKNGLTWKRYYDSFDFVSWFNGSGHKITQQSEAEK